MSWLPPHVEDRINDFLLVLERVADSLHRIADALERLESEQRRK